jgi:DNA invertase Pin-like site-specific DNA recombinase
MKMSVEQAEQTIPDDFGMERALDQVQKAGANFRSLADAWCDTSPPHGQLLVTVLGGLAQFERTLIQARTGEGRKRAQAAGVVWKAVQDEPTSETRGP